MKISKTLSIWVPLLLILGLSSTAHADWLRLAAQGTLGTTTVNRGNSELDFQDADLPQSDFGAGVMAQVVFKLTEGFHIGPYFDYKTSDYDYTDTDNFGLKVPAVGLVNRVSALPIIIQVSVGYSFGEATDIKTDGVDTTTVQGDLIGIQTQVWLGYEIPIENWFSIDVGGFFTYDGMNFKDDHQPDRDIKKGPKANTLMYTTFGLGVQANFDVL